MQFLLPCMLSLAALLCVARGGEPIGYQTPPEWVAWMEGEDVVSTNWTPGESRHAWWHEYAGLTGRGYLLLAADKLPEGGEFFADFEFTLPEAGNYRLYWRGRFPGYQACPIMWSVNGGVPQSQPRPGSPPDAGVLDRVVNHKMVLADLGEFEGREGKNTLRITVREPLHDQVQALPGEESRRIPFFVQGIDSLSVSKVEYATLPDTVVIVPPAKGSDFIINPFFGVSAGDGKYHGEWMKPQVGDWSGYDRLRVSLRVTGETSEAFEGRLRCLYKGSEFIDLPISVKPDEFGRYVNFSFDLNEKFSGVSRANIHALWFYTFDNWYTESAGMKIDLIGLQLTEPNEQSRQPVVVPPSGRPAPGLEATRRRAVSNFVWNVTSDEESDVSVETQVDDPTQDGVALEAGSLQAIFSPVNGGVRKLSLGDRVLQRSAAAEPPVRLFFLDDSAWAPEKPGSWKREGDALVFHQSDKQAEVTVTVRSEAGEIRMQSAIRNKAEQPIARVAFRMMQGAQIKGELIAGTRRHRYGSYVKPQTHVSPTKFTNDWFCLFDDGATLHARIEDPDYLDSRATYARPNQVGVVATIEKFIRIRPGEEWIAPVVVMGADASGSWYQAATRFREWFWRTAHRPFIPDWFKEIGGLSVGWSFFEADALDQNAALIEETEALSGVRLHHSGTWLPLQTEAWYPLNYRLDPANLSQLAKMTEAFREQGARLSIYTNPLMFSMVTADYAEYGREHEFAARDGFPYRSEHDFRHHPMSIPWPDARWAKRFGDALEQVIETGQPDVLYMDQLGAVPTHLNFDPEKHGHQHYGEWRRVQAEFAKAIEQRFRQIQPELATGIENPNIAAQQWVTFALLTYDSDPEVLRFLFPYFTHFIGNYGDIDEAKIRVFAEDAFLGGVPLLFFRGTAKRLPPEAREQLRKLVLAKRELDPLLYSSVYQGARGVQATAGVRAHGFQGDGFHLITFINSDASPASVIVDPAVFGCDPQIQATLLGWNDDPGIPLESLRTGKGEIEIKLPTARFGVIQIQPAE